MRMLKDMELMNVVKIRENNVPVDYIVVRKITPDNPFYGYTSGIIVCRKEVLPDKYVYPIILLSDEAQVDDSGFIV